MRARRLAAVLGIVLLALAGLGVAAPVAVPPEPEALVEGHTVYAVLEQVTRNAADREEYAAAVAVLVREVTWDERSFRFPGVLWFNDQYLVNPAGRAAVKDPTYRHVCTGAVIAVPRGDPDPQTIPGAFSAANYVETYHVKDPNDWDWDVDKWVVNGRPVWTVAINNRDADYATPDSPTATDCAPRSDRLCGGVNVLPFDYEDRPSPYNDSGFADNRRATTCGRCSSLGPGTAACQNQFPGQRAAAGGYAYPCGGTTTDTSPKKLCAPFVQYNALLFFFLADLTVANATKDHADGSTDRARDASGCDADSVNMSVPDYRVWPCPGGDDAREGNSHAYNPGLPWPRQTYSGRDNHGGSADCTGDAQGDQLCHATRDIDIYYGVAARPPRSPATTVFTDGEGVTAPYHCHATMDVCNQRDVFADAGTDDPT